MVRKLPEIIRQPDFEKLFKAVSDKEKKSKVSSYKLRLKKIRLAMLLGFEAGLRISEIVGYKDIKPLTKDRVEPAMIRISQGKGKKDRVVPRPKRMNEAAVKLLPVDIAYRSLQDFITKLGKKVLQKHITFHTLRHGFGSHLAGQGRPLHEIQMLMGHSRLDTTGVYLHANPVEAIKKAQEVF